MPLKTFPTLEYPRICAQPLTPQAFAPYGGVISADHQIASVSSSAANYGTAVKIHKVAPVVNRFAQCPSQKPATARWNIFRCSAPKHMIACAGNRCSYTAKVLERHPFSTQSFLPMGQDLEKNSYLVIVASENLQDPQRLPEPSSVKAFICKGNQSVTYGPGVWHAPMVVIDAEVPHIDFAVFIHENDVADEDCQECYFDPGYVVDYANPYPHNSKL